MKNLHLLMSVIIIIPVALAYGVMPAVTLKWLFNITVTTVDMFSILRAMMTLYLGMTAIWVVGIIKQRYWQTATITNVIFMGSLALGRLLSFVLDGMPSPIFFTGFFFEVLLAAFGYINLHRYASGQT